MDLNRTEVLASAAMVEDAVQSVVGSTCWDRYDGKSDPNVFVTFRADRASFTVVIAPNLPAPCPAGSVVPRRHARDYLDRPLTELLSDLMLEPVSPSFLSAGYFEPFARRLPAALRPFDGAGSAIRAYLQDGKGAGILTVILHDRASGLFREVGSEYIWPTAGDAESFVMEQACERWGGDIIGEAVRYIGARSEAGKTLADFYSVLLLDGRAVSLEPLPLYLETMAALRTKRVAEHKCKSATLSFCWGDDDEDTHLMTVAAKGGKVTILVRDRKERSARDAEAALRPILNSTLDVLAGVYDSVDDQWMDACRWGTKELVEACDGVFKSDDLAELPAVSSAQRAWVEGALDIVVYEESSERYILLSPANGPTKHRLTWVRSIVALPKNEAEERCGSDVIAEFDRYAAAFVLAEKDGPPEVHIRIVDGVLVETPYPEFVYQPMLLEWEQRQAKKSPTPPAPASIAPQAEVSPLRSLMEMTADPEECVYDQPCGYGHRVGGHAVYCHNDDWADAPRKCRRTRYTGGLERDEDCPGYKPNPSRVSD